MVIDFVELEPVHQKAVFDKVGDLLKRSLNVRHLCICSSYVTDRWVKTLAARNLHFPYLQSANLANSSQSFIIRGSPITAVHIDGLNGGPSDRDHRLLILNVNPNSITHFDCTLTTNDSSPYACLYIIRNLPELRRLCVRDRLGRDDTCLPQFVMDAISRLHSLEEMAWWDLFQTTTPYLWSGRCHTLRKVTLGLLVEYRNKDQVKGYSLGYGDDYSRDYGLCYGQEARQRYIGNHSVYERAGSSDCWVLVNAVTGLRGPQ